MEFLYDLPVDGGKYRFRFSPVTGLSVLRHGEPWWTPDAGSKAIISLMDGEERRQKAIQFVLERDGASLADDRAELLEILGHEDPSS